METLKHNILIPNSYIPILTETFKYIENYKKVLVVIPDSTRPIYLLNNIIKKILEGINGEAKVLIGGGTHRQFDLSYYDGFGFPTYIHNAYTSETEVIGITELGSPIYINKLLLWADCIVCVGIMKPHHFVGFSGGLKAIFPGCAGINFIKNNHNLKDKTTSFGNIETNTIRKDIIDATNRLSKPVFVINCIIDIRGNCFWACGENDNVVLKMKDKAVSHYSYLVEKKYKRVLVLGIYNESRNLYQTLRWLAHAGPFLEDGGEIILNSKCDEGLGTPVDNFSQRVINNRVGKYLPSNYTIKLISSLPDKDMPSSIIKCDSSDCDLQITHATYVMPIGGGNANSK